MVLSVSIYPNLFRHDSTILPVLSGADVSGDIGYFQIENWLYFPFQNEDKPFLPPNRTKREVSVKLKDCSFPTLTYDANISQGVGATIERSSGTGYAGAYTTTALSDTKCSIQMKTASTYYSTGISLQDGSGTIEDDYTVATVAHSILLGQSGLGIIRELGELVVNNAFFKYEIGDSVMIELDNGIVRYYLFKENGEMQLIRTTRSKLTEAPKAEIMLYYPESRAEDVYVCDGESLIAETTFENIGVAYNQRFDGVSNKLSWQKWQNPRAIQTIGDALEMADKRQEFTYPNEKTSLVSFQITPLAKNKTAMRELENFFRWHKNDTEFIFLDYARKDDDGNPTEYWMRFAAAISDQTKNGCVFDESVQMIEDFRNEYVPREDDTTPPTVSLDSISDDTLSIGIDYTASDNVLLTQLALYKNGVFYNYLELDEVSYAVPKADLIAGVNSFYIIATDYAGNNTQSNTDTYNYVP